MPDTCWDKVEDGFLELIEAMTETGEDLEGWIVETEASKDEAVDVEGQNVIRIWTVSAEMNQSDEQNQTLHTTLIEIEFATGGGAAGTLNRTNRSAAAVVHAAIAADRTLGGMLFDTQETSIAPAAAEGKDVSGASLQYQVQFFTARDNWFTIYGQGGATF